MHYKLPILGYRIEDVAYITDMLYISEEEISVLRTGYLCNTDSSNAL